MPITRKIKEILLPRAEEIKVEDVRIGLGYTAVLLENGQAGVAYTFREPMSKGCTVFTGLHPLAGRKASELLGFIDSFDKLEMAVALATVNAMANTPHESLLEGDIIDHLHIEPDDSIGMIGSFAPLIPALKKKASSVMVFEQVKEKQGDFLPEEEAVKLLPQCQVALITSTSIVNHTLGSIMDSVKSCREVALLGASTPLLPKAFVGTPVTFLSGIVVTRPGEILRIISEGGGMKFFRDNIRKVNLRIAQSA